MLVIVSAQIDESLVTSMNILAPGERGIPFMLAAAACATIAEPPMTTSAVLVELAYKCIPLRATTSNLDVVSWSNLVAVVVIANALKSCVANFSLPVSDTKIDISFFSARTPLTSLGILPSSSTLTVREFSVRCVWPAIVVGLYLRI